MARAAVVRAAVIRAAVVCAAPVCLAVVAATVGLGATVMALQAPAVRMKPILHVVQVAALAVQVAQFGTVQLSH